MDGFTHKSSDGMVGSPRLLIVTIGEILTRLIASEKRQSLNVD
jgi:hypothetical protein